VVVPGPAGETLRLYVVTGGRSGGRPPVVLLHGLPTTSAGWTGVLHDLGHDHLCVAPDLPGLGRSERPGDRAVLRLDAQARVLLRLLDVLGHARVVLVGHDLGGAVAVHAAALAPERVAGLTLIAAPVTADAWPVPAVLPFLLPGIGRLAPRLLRGSYGGEAGTGVAAFARAVDLAPVEASLRLVRAAPPPTLVLWGEADALHAPAYGRRVARLLGATWVPVADAGHLLPQERPERVAEEVAAWSAGLPAAPPAG